MALCCRLHQRELLLQSIGCQPQLSRSSFYVTTLCTAPVMRTCGAPRRLPSWCQMCWRQPAGGITHWHQGCSRPAARFCRGVWAAA